MSRWLLLLLGAWPLCGLAAWQAFGESPAGVRMIDLARVERQGEQIRFHERISVHAGQVDPASQRPLREVLERRVMDCRTARVATVSRAVFSDQDALIEYRVSRVREADWQPLAADDARLRLLCRRP